jgi:hypothetical protein
MKNNQQESAEGTEPEKAADPEHKSGKSAGQAGAEQAGQEAAAGKTAAGQAEADKGADDATAKAVEKALAEERRKAAKAIEAAVKAAVDKQAADLEEQKRREQMAEADRLKLELDEHKRKADAADAAAKRARLELAMHRAMTTDGVQPAGESAVPLIEAEFLKRAETGETPNDALAGIKKTHGFLFKQPEVAAKKPVEQGRADAGAGTRLAGANETPKFNGIKPNANYQTIAEAVYQRK